MRTPVVKVRKKEKPKGCAWTIYKSDSRTDFVDRQRVVMTENKVKEYMAAIVRKDKKEHEDEWKSGTIHVKDITDNELGFLRAYSEYGNVKKEYIARKEY